MSSPSEKTDPVDQASQQIYVVIEVLNDLVIVPTLVHHLRGVFTKREDAINTAWNRIHRANPERSWALDPRQIPVVGKELFVVAVEADSCVLVVYVEQRPLQRQEMSWADIDELTLTGRF